MVFSDDYVGRGVYNHYTTKKGGEKPPFLLHCNFNVLAFSTKGNDLRCVRGGQEHLLCSIASIVQPTCGGYHLEGFDVNLVVIGVNLNL